MLTHAGSEALSGGPKISHTAAPHQQRHVAVFLFRVNVDVGLGASAGGFEAV
jgi:hypothetical protein